MRGSKRRGQSASFDAAACIPAKIQSSAIRLTEGGFIISSANKTENIGLNLWEATDQVLRVDFNSDNEKTDAAIAAAAAASPLAKLFDVTTSEEATQADLDLSGIDLYQYSRLEVQIEASGNVTSGVMIRLNGVSSNYLYSNGSNAAYFGYAYIIQGSGPSICFFNMHLRPENGSVKAAILTSGSYNHNAACYSMGPGMAWISSLADVKTLNLITLSTTYKISAGAKIIVYGVKK